MSNPETTKNQNESYEPSEALESLANAPSFEEHMQQVQAKREFQEKYGDHIIWEALDENDPKTQEMFKEYPWTKERYDEAKNAPVDESEESPFGSGPGLGPNEFI